ncbi:hypothetical protein RCH17_000113 [Arthrobacter sp. MP_M7]|nr:hypothetical protein [Arthrobacter sp. MP_M4]MEC5201334.1 hypothetical protein [Arthrobacter sp. MP_M7]
MNTLVGHFTGLATGVLCLYVFGLQDSPPAPVGGWGGSCVAAGAVSVALQGPPKPGWPVRGAA